MRRRLEGKVPPGRSVVTTAAVAGVETTEIPVMIEAHQTRLHRERWSQYRQNDCQNQTTSFHFHHFLLHISDTQNKTRTRPQTANFSHLPSIVKDRNQPETGLDRKYSTSRISVKS